MINSTNIRVGNLCFKDAEVHVITALDILNIDECESRNSFHGFTPIPLIETWLEKLGFEKKLDDWYNKKFYTNIDMDDIQLIHVNLISYRCSLSIEDASDFIYTSKEIKYVHQLQNLYFILSDRELELIKK